MNAAELHALAGEYALSLLDPVDRIDVERRAEREPALAAAIAEWRDRLVEIDASAAPLAPSADLWPRIGRALDGERHEAQAKAVPARPSGGSGFWSNVAALRGLSLAGAAASLALAFVAITAYQAAQRQPQVIAVLLRADQTPGAVVEVFADGSSYVASLADVEVPADRALQVWTLPDPATGPVSIGLLGRDPSARLDAVSLPSPKPRQLYEITLEPAGGSPTGKPTGPILFKGFAERPR